jgi:hypothetical protein
MLSDGEFFLVLVFCVPPIVIGFLWLVMILAMLAKAFCK